MHHSDNLYLSLQTSSDFTTVLCAVLEVLVVCMSNICSYFVFLRLYQYTDQHEVSIQHKGKVNPGYLSTLSAQ